MRRIVLSREARTDFGEIWRHIVDLNERAADDLIRRLNDRIQTASEFPEIGAPRPAFGAGIRMLAEGNYLILYEIWPDAIFVSRVVHGARDLTAL